MLNMGLIESDDLAVPKKMEEELLYNYGELYSDGEHEPYIRQQTGSQERAYQLQLFVDFLCCDTAENEWTVIVEVPTTEERQS